MSIKNWIIDKISLLFQPIVERCIDRITDRELTETINLIKESDAKSEQVTIDALKRYRDTRKIKNLSDDIQKMQRWKIEKERNLAKQRKKKKSIKRVKVNR